MKQTPHQQLIGRLKDRTAAIGIVGMGYVGLPLALRFADAGYRVRGFDIEPERVDLMNRGGSHIAHIREDRVAGRWPGASAPPPISRKSPQWMR